MTDWNTGAQPFCKKHGWVYHSCCTECRHEHGKETDTEKCKACKRAGKK
jgi:hypothetical protein